MTFITKLLKDLRYDHKTMKLQQTVAEDLLSTFEFAGSPEDKRAAADILEKLFHRKGITTATKKNIAEHYILLRCWGRGGIQDPLPHNFRSEREDCRALAKGAENRLVNTLTNYSCLIIDALDKEHFDSRQSYVFYRLVDAQLTRLKPGSMVIATSKDLAFAC